MSLFALTLSACVGAVNLAAGTIAEAKTEKTEPETKTPKKLVIEEPEPQDKKMVETVEPKPIIAVEPKPISANPCIANPFGDTCTENFATERESITMKCINDVTGDLCHQAITQVCLNTFSPRLCNKIPTYLDEFKACGYELDSESCAPTITRACHDFGDNFGSNFGDVFNLLCEEAVEPETKEVVKYKPTRTILCLRNPFDRDCNENFNNARELACASEKNSYRCRTTIYRVCRTDSLNALCEDNPTYSVAQETICANEPKSDRCAPTIRRVCGANPLNALCDDNAIYYPAQYMACKIYFSNPRCASTIARVCDADIFDALCRFIQVYQSARETVCTSEPDSERCIETLKVYCGRNPFISLCSNHSDSNASRESACYSEPNSDRCKPTILRICIANPFHTLCDNNETYYPAKETTCMNEPNSLRCHSTLDRVCAVNAFNTLCQLSYLTLRDIPAQIRINGDFMSTSDNSPSATCRTIWHSSSHEYRCWALVPDIINIKPLNNTNTGTATYAGSVVLQDASNRHHAYTHGIAPALTKNIDIIADFDNSTLSYSGNLGSDSFSNLTFSINGTFTDRGILTGTVNFRTIEAPLMGLIGQDEAIGVFTVRAGDTHNNSNKSFAGGFTATREQ